MGVVMIRLLVAASGGGTTFQAIAEACRNGQIEEAEVAGLFVDRDCRAIARAGDLGIPVFNATGLEKPERIDTFCAAREKIEADMILCAGYLKKVPGVLIGAMPHCILNSHPAPIELGGKGMWGIIPHHAALYLASKTGRFWTCATVFEVSHEWDEGPVKSEVWVPFYGVTTAKELQQILLPFEYPGYITLINRCVETWKDGQPHLTTVVRAFDLVPPGMGIWIEQSNEYGRSFSN